VARRLSFFLENIGGFVMIRGTVLVDTEFCKGCELCVEACPQHCLTLSETFNKKGYRYAQLEGDTCTGCENCALICPDAVLTVYREPRKKKSSSSRPQVAA
jgi:2-oxoglutarate ferredoxin oxidoreductase subunit delta